MNKSEDYKDSGVEWIGMIPKHWELIKLRYLCDITTGGKNTEDNVENGEYPFFVRSPKIERINSWSFDGEAVLTAGDGAVGKIFHHYIGKFDFHQRVYKFSNFQLVLGRYFYWFLRENFQHEILRWNAKTTVDSVRLPFLQNFPMVLPPIEEQKLISNYLDKKTGQIDSLVTKKTRFLELIKEKILAIAMNEQIHGGGEFDRLRRLTKVISNPATIIDDDEYVALGLYNRGRGHFHKPATLGKDMGDSSFFTVEEGDLILSGQFAWEGAVTMASDKETGSVVSHRYPIIRGKSIATEYLLALLMTDFGNFLLNESSRGAAGRNKPLNIRILLNEKIRIPSLEAQNEIRRLMYFRAQAEKKFKKSTELLKEYRQSLISSVVTGKIRITENMV